MKKLIAAIKLIRPVNGLVAALSVVPAASIACGELTFPWRESGLIFFLVSFGYAINDIFDLRADLINRPKRAIPSGVLSVKNAWVIAVSFLIAGTAFLFGANPICALYYLSVASALYLYAATISSWLIVGNVLVAVLCASVFYLGALGCEVEGKAVGLLILSAILTFLYHLGREIVKDIEDMSGDKAIKRSTVPLKWGPNRARVAAIALFGVLIATSYSGYWVLELSRSYLVAISVGVNLPLALIFIIYMRKGAEEGAGQTSMALKVIMLPALMALLLAGVN